MEPADLNPTPERDDARLEALLREPAAALPDDGFSARVLAALPPAPTPIGRTRTLICIIAAGLGTLIAIAGIGAPKAWAASWTSVGTALAPLGSQLADPTVLAALVVAAVSVLYAFRSEMSRRLTL